MSLSRKYNKVENNSNKIIIMKMIFQMRNFMKINQCLDHFLLKINKMNKIKKFLQIKINKKMLDKIKQNKKKVKN